MEGPEVKGGHDSIKSLSLSDVKDWVSRCTNEELKAAMKDLADQSDAQWQMKSCLLFSGKDEVTLRSSLAEVMSLGQVLAVLEADPQDESKLEALFVGMSLEVFDSLVSRADLSLLRLLQREAAGEPVQHKLTVFVHLLEQEERAITHSLEILRARVEGVTVEGMTTKKFQGLLREIQEHHDKVMCGTERIDKALAVAWTSGRTDLIEKLSQLKEYLCSDQRFGLGLPQGVSGGPTGLYLLLQRRLESVFGDPDTDNPETLKDEDSAVEALAKLSLWNLKDYWDVGLLPEVEKAPGSQAEDVIKPEGERLRAQAISQLKALDLATTKDFKRHQIYSKQMLQEYIERHQDRLIYRT